MREGLAGSLQLARLAKLASLVTLAVGTGGAVAVPERLAQAAGIVQTSRESRSARQDVPPRPRVDAVSGTTAHGERVVITGAGFGQQRATPLLWDDFEGGIEGARIAAAPAVGGWKPVDPRTSTYSTSQSHSGLMSLRAMRTPTAQWGNFDVELPDARDFYQSFWFRYRYPGTEGNAKLIQIHGNHGKGDYNPGVMTGGFSGSWWASYIALEDTGMHRRVSYAAAPAQDRWHLVEMILRQSGAGRSDGTVIVRIDGRDVYRQDLVMTRERPDRRWTLATFFTGMTNFVGPTETWIDDVYLNDGWARVELCESPSHAECARKQLQPHVEWSDQRIVVRFNQGALQAGEAAYLFVIDSEGRPQRGGHRIVVGERHGTAQAVR